MSSEVKNKGRNTEIDPQTGKRYGQSAFGAMAFGRCFGLKR